MSPIELAPTVGAAFLASLVECVEAATILLAVGMVRGWRSALIGMGLALAVLFGLVASLGPALAQAPERALQLVVGLLLLLFGMRWLRKAMLRGAGILPLHDEEAVFRTEAANFALARATARWGVDPVAAATAFKAVLLEGVEVAFLVLAVSAGSPALVLPAALSALAAAALVSVALVIVHRPLSRVPENTLKFCVGVIVSAFGIFWTGEGLGIAWPGDDLALIGIALVLLAASLAWVRLAAAALPARQAR